LSTHSDLDAIFCANDPMAMAALEAVRADRSDAIIVGFNADAEAVKSVKEGGLAATIAQSSYNIGYRGVETAIKVFNGESVPAHVDTGTDLVTSDNADKFLD
ncbi:MAG: substrate-binding domain-containing protein, partial [Planctomycetaceae bacterium]|nr:substrate-binding domain-containing protein [Planctomycetaceae bacterium]